MRQCLYTSCYKIIVQVAGVLSNSLIILRNICISVTPSLPLATNSVMLKNINSVCQIILYMYKGVIIHQLSSLNICFTTFINKNGLSTCSPHYSSPCSPFHTFHNFQKLQKSHFLFSFRFRFLWSQQSFLSIWKKITNSWTNFRNIAENLLEQLTTYCSFKH